MHQCLVIEIRIRLSAVLKGKFRAITILVSFPLETKTYLMLVSYSNKALLPDSGQDPILDESRQRISASIVIMRHVSAILLPRSEGDRNCCRFGCEPVQKGIYLDHSE